jgi:Fe-S cluster biogenesis protein NfuA
MSRTDEEIIQTVKELIETRIQPAVSSHGGIINFVSYKDAHLLLELSGACAGCAGSTATLKFGVENMVKHYIPEVQTVEAVHDTDSGVAPYFVNDDPFRQEAWEKENIIPVKEIKQ